MGQDARKTPSIRDLVASRVSFLGQPAATLNVGLWDFISAVNFEMEVGLKLNQNTFSLETSKSPVKWN